MQPSQPRSLPPFFPPSMSKEERQQARGDSKDGRMASKIHGEAGFIRQSLRALPKVKRVLKSKALRYTRKHASKLELQSRDAAPESCVGSSVLFRILPQSHSRASRPSSSPRLPKVPYRSLFEHLKQQHIRLFTKECS